MEEKLRCPRASERKTPPQNDELIDPECGECPLLMREVDERGVISLYCLVYRNRFRSSGPAISVAGRAPSAATWRRESRSP
jgi:hypothetical protein